MMATPAILPINDKFSSLALSNVSTRLWAAPYSLGGATIHDRCPFDVDKHWQEWLGSITTEQLQESNLLIVTHAPSGRPEVLDDENEALNHQATLAFYALMLVGVPHMEGDGILISGASPGGVVEIRSVSRVARFYRLAKTRPSVIDEESIETAGKILTGLQTIETARPSYARLRRGISAVIRTLRESDPGERLHWGVRALEALTLPRKGAGRGVFSERCKTFAVARDDLLQEMFDARSTVEHMNDISSFFGTEADSETRGLLRVYQAERMMSFSYARVLTDPELLSHFREDGTIREFWRLPPSTRASLWGDRVALNDLTSDVNFE